jgi:hypothetical protein
MYHSQRLPRCRIERAEVSDKVFLEEHPALTDLGTWNLAQLGTAPELFGVQLEEFGSLFKIK